VLVADMVGKSVSTFVSLKCEAKGVKLRACWIAGSDRAVQRFVKACRLRKVTTAGHFQAWNLVLLVPSGRALGVLLHRPSRLSLSKTVTVIGGSTGGPMGWRSFFKRGLRVSVRRARLFSARWRSEHCTCVVGYGIPFKTMCCNLLVKTAAGFHAGVLVSPWLRMVCTY
jgi:hypothetical protein